MAGGALTAAEVDRWPVGTSGLGERVARCVQRAGLQTIGQLRTRLAEGPAIAGLGRAGRRQVEAFLTKPAASLPATMREWLAALLTPGEQGALEVRYGLTDPLWRTTMRLCRLREVGAARGLSATGAGYVCRRARRTLQSRLGRALAGGLAGRRPPQEAGLELRTWRGQAWLGGYEPWGAAALLEEVLG